MVIAAAWNKLLARRRLSIVIRLTSIQMPVLVFLEVITDGFRGILALGLCEFAHDDVIHIHTKRIGHHDAIRKHIR